MTAPTFDRNGFFGKFHPRHPETFQFSIYAGRTTAERIALAAGRKAMTEAPKCEGFFTGVHADCDLAVSHSCVDGTMIHAG